MHKFFILCCLVSISGVSFGQTAAASPGPGWDQVKLLQPLTHIHVSTDSGSKTCKLFAVSDDSLTCATGPGNSMAGMVFKRSSIKSIKRTRYLLSALVGLGVGVGAGLGIGRLANPPQPNSFIDLHEVAIAGYGVIGGLAGLAIGGPTDMLRGPTVYVRP